MNRLIVGFSLRTGLVVIALILLAACKSGSEGDNVVAAQRSISVTLAIADQQEIQVELHSIGRLVSLNTPLLAAEINARVVKVLVEEGQPVRQNQVLILLDTTATELTRREAEANIEQLKASIANEERRVARYQDLKTKNMMSQERLDDAEAKLAVDRASMSAAQARLAIAEDRLSKHPTQVPDCCNDNAERKCPHPAVAVNDRLCLDMRLEGPHPGPEPEVVRAWLENVKQTSSGGGDGGAADGEPDSSEPDSSHSLHRVSFNISPE